MVASLASLDSSSAISAKMPIFQKQAEMLFMRASFPSHAMQVVLPDHQAFLSGSLTISTGYFCIVPSLNLQHSSPPPGPSRSSGVGAFEIERWKYQIAFGGIAKVGTARKWGGSPLASAEAGTLMHAWTLDKKSPRTKWGLESSTLCLADKEICLGTSNQESEQGKRPLQG